MKTLSRVARDRPTFISLLVICILFLPFQFPSVPPALVGPPRVSSPRFTLVPLVPYRPGAMSNMISDVVALNGTRSGRTELGEGLRGFRCVKNVRRIF